MYLQIRIHVRTRIRIHVRRYIHAHIHIPICMNIRMSIVISIRILIHGYISSISSKPQRLNQLEKQLSLLQRKKGLRGSWLLRQHSAFKQSKLGCCALLKIPKQPRHELTGSIQAWIHQEPEQIATTCPKIHNRHDPLRKLQTLVSDLLDSCFRRVARSHLKLTKTRTKHSLTQTPTCKFPKISML